MKLGSWSLFFAALNGALMSVCFAAQPVSSVEQDSPMKVIEKERVVFPERLKNDGVLGGEAQLVIYVDSTGKLVDALVVAYSREAFATAALDAVKTWKFEPGRVKGKPFGTVAHMTFHFQVNGVLVIDRTNKAPNDLDDWIQFRSYNYKPCSPDKLDNPLKSVNCVPPDYPKALHEKGVSGRVMVSFYVDENGKARLPVATSGQDALLSGMAVSAVEQWQFEPPTSKGKPVLVHALQEFCFVAQK